MNDDVKKNDFRTGLISISKIWGVVFLIVAFFITIIQLWGTQIPIEYYPYLFLKLIINPFFLALYVFVVGLPVMWSLWLRHRERVSRDKQKNGQAGPK